MRSSNAFAKTSLENIVLWKKELKGKFALPLKRLRTLFGEVFAR